MNRRAVRFTYTNYRGETRERLVLPVRFYFGTHDYYPEPQWLCDAYDSERDGAETNESNLRTFALVKIKDWRPA